jgi:hypothetical protein
VHKKGFALIIFVMIILMVTWRNSDPRTGGQKWVATNTNYHKQYINKTNR